MEQWPTPRMPKPVLVALSNETGLSAFQYSKMGVGRVFFDVVVIKGEYRLASGVLTDPRPGNVVIADDFWDPTDVRTSLRVPGDAILIKPGTDVFVTGTAHAPRRTERWRAGVTVRRERRTLLDHQLDATGPRRWEHRALLGWRLSEAAPTSEVPIRYELAYGGAHRDPSETSDEAWEMYEPNPSGRGFCNADALDTERTYDAPQWELPEHPVTGMNEHVPPAGFGPISRAWLPRRRHAGTYDDAWLKRAMHERRIGLPLDYAPDFDARFFQAAAAALIADPHLNGDESVTLTGLCRGAPELTVRLPGVSARALLTCDVETWRTIGLPLDTIHFDLDRMCVSLCWRLTLAHSERVMGARLLLEKGK